MTASRSTVTADHRGCRGEGHHARQARLLLAQTNRPTLIRSVRPGSASSSTSASSYGSNRRSEPIAAVPARSLQPPSRLDGPGGSAAPSRMTRSESTRCSASRPRALNCAGVSGALRARARASARDRTLRSARERGSAPRRVACSPRDLSFAIRAPLSGVAARVVAASRSRLATSPIRPDTTLCVKHIDLLQSVLSASQICPVLGPTTDSVLRRDRLRGRRNLPL